MIKTLRNAVQAGQGEICRAEVGAGGHPVKDYVGGRHFPCGQEQIRKDI